MSLNSAQGASDDILNAKNTLYKHLTWDSDKSTSLCSKLALPLNTPANSSPPPSPKRVKDEDTAKGPAATTAGTAADGECDRVRLCVQLCCTAWHGTAADVIAGS